CQHFIRARCPFSRHHRTGSQGKKQRVFLLIEIKNHLTRCHGKYLPECSRHDRTIRTQTTRYSLDASQFESSEERNVKFENYCPRFNPASCKRAGPSRWIVRQCGSCARPDATCPNIAPFASNIR